MHEAKESRDEEFVDEAYLQLLDEGWIDQAIDLVQSQRKKLQDSDVSGLGFVKWAFDEYLEMVEHKNEEDKDYNPIVKIATLCLSSNEKLCQDIVLRAYNYLVKFDKSMAFELAQACEDKLRENPGLDN